MENIGIWIMYKTSFQKHQFPKKFYDSYNLYKFHHNSRYLQHLAIYLEIENR